jgi:hypothetical protein
VDFRVVPLEILLEGLAAQKHRRFMKTHLPLDALVFSPKAKYLYVIRDGRDVAWSMFNHHAGFTEQMYPMMNNIFGREGDPLVPPTNEVRQYFLEWLDGGGLPLGVSFWNHVQGWFNLRHLPNVLLLHFNDLKADLPGQMRRIAAFLGIAIDDAKMPAMLEHCSLDYMRAHASEHSPIIDMIFQQGRRDLLQQGHQRPLEGRADGDRPGEVRPSRARKPDARVRPVDGYGRALACACSSWKPSAAFCTSGGKSAISCTWRTSMISLSLIGARLAHSSASSFDFT